MGINVSQSINTCLVSINADNIFNVIFSTINIINPRSRINDIITGTGKNIIIPGSSLYVVIPGTAIYIIITVTTIKKVITIFSVKKIMPAIAIKRIIVVSAPNFVSTHSSLIRVGAATQMNDVYISCIIMTAIRIKRASVNNIRSVSTGIFI